MNARTEELIRYANELAENIAKAAPDMYLAVLFPKRLMNLSASDLLEFAEHFGSDVSTSCGTFECKASIHKVSVWASTEKIEAAKPTTTPMDVLRATVSQAQSIAA